MRKRKVGRVVPAALALATGMAGSVGVPLDSAEARIFLCDSNRPLRQDTTNIAFAIARETMSERFALLISGEIQEWGNKTNVNVNEAQGDTVWRKVNDGANGTTAVATYNFDRDSCRINTLTTVSFNSHYMDDEPDPSVQVTAIHEMGHVVGLKHDLDERFECRPDTVMLRFKSQRYNYTCQWKEPHSIDLYETNSIY